MHAMPAHDTRLYPRFSPARRARHRSSRHRSRVVARTCVGADIEKEYTMNVSIARGRVLYVVAIVVLGIVAVSGATPRAQSVAAKETSLMVERALSRLPYYGVFDFLVFAVDRGTVNV